MTRKEKDNIVSSVGEEFSKAQAVIVCNYSGVTCDKLELLRSDAKSKDTKVQVIKNSLAKLAFNKSGISDIELSSTNIFIWSDDQINASKVAVNFAKDNENFFVKNAVIENEIVDASMIDSLSKLPGRDELIGMLLSVWTAPARNFVTGLDNLRDKKEQEQE
jgi:large subunit ribosomal protein L10